tara:strand:- start:500 stop:790 length:291 start_codon:yes stop_codon:yes gene_type:complete
MAYEKKENDISVFYNPPEKKTNPNSPDWTGEALIEGKVMRVAFWAKTPTMLAGKIEIKQAGHGAAQGGNPAAPAASGYAGAQATPAAQTDLEEVPF